MEKNEDETKKELNEDEAEEGLEMENEFDGRW